LARPSKKPKTTSTKKVVRPGKPVPAILTSICPELTHEAEEPNDFLPEVIDWNVDSVTLNEWKARSGNKDIMARHIVGRILNLPDDVEPKQAANALGMRVQRLRRKWGQFTNNFSENRKNKNGSVKAKEGKKSGVPAQIEEIAKKHSLHQLIYVSSNISKINTHADIVY